MYGSDNATQIDKFTRFIEQKEKLRENNMLPYKNLFKYEDSNKTSYAASNFWKSSDRLLANSNKDLTSNYLN